MTINAKKLNSQANYGHPDEITNGIFLVRMPLPFKLDHINLYLIFNNDSWTLIDTGLDTDHTKEVWESLFDGFLSEYPLKNIIVTHHHPDHIGMTSWLQQRTGATVHISTDEINTANALLDMTRDGNQVLVDHYSRFGLNEEFIEEMVAKGPSYKRLVKNLPVDTTVIDSSTSFNIGGTQWDVKIGRGHSPEHVCLWDESNSILISGDHILPSISPNISIMAKGLVDPLSDYLNTLGEFRNLPAKIYLPSHGLPSVNYKSRIDDLIGHHHSQLDVLESFCSTPKTVNECALKLYGEKLPPHQYGFAVGEAAAHLVHLANENRLKMDKSNAWIFMK